MSRTSDDGVVATWKEILGLGDQDLDDSGNFFTLGGDSLQAVELIQALEDKFDIVLEVEVLFYDGTLGALKTSVADRVEQAPR